MRKTAAFFGCVISPVLVSRLLQFRIMLLLLATVAVAEPSFSQCSPGAITVSANNTVLNTYYPATSSLAVGGKSIVLGASAGSGTTISKGDLLLIIQMQGSAVNSNNGLDYGDGVAGGNAAGYTSSVAGTYEYEYAANGVGAGGGTLYLVRGAANAYTNAAATGTAGAYRYQVIRVPRYTTFTINLILGGSVTATPWNGGSGGVVAFDASGALSPNGYTFVTVSNQGFRGGGGRQLGGTAGLLSTDNRSASTSNGSKGEGIAGTPRYVRTSGTTTLVDAGSETYPNGSNGNGAPGNAGGGGTDGNPAAANDQNSGGGGGGNAGAGGRGGKTWSSNLSIGGYGGVAPGFLSTGRLIMGGGAGAGSTNDGTGGAPAGIASSGGAGGGLVLIRVGSISGSGTITATGEIGATPNNDGGGGGGAGGTVYISSVTTAGLANITVNARGGNGGNSNAGTADNGTLDDGNPEHGPGGGGGGGAVYANGTINAASSAAGGTNGTTLTNTQAFGATSGTAGVINQSAAVIAAAVNAACDVDADDDGVTNANESGGVDPYADADSDGIPNLYDAAPGAGVPAFTDANSDGISDGFDADKDGIINAYDLDSDNDGIPDIKEAGGTDTNGDGVADSLTDTDGDGLVNTYDTDNGGTTIPNTDSDGDGIPNARDLDSDNDGITDLTEAGGIDTDGNGTIDGFADSDGDGLGNTYDNTSGGVAIANLDTDLDGIPNFRDLDSDNDGIPDVVEAGGTDTNNDGKIDGFTDTDGDGLAQSVDGDANNDGTSENTAGALIITSAVGGTAGRPASYPRANADANGFPNPYDLDADGDGITDARESGLTQDTNNDGVIKSGDTGFTDSNGDGWSDQVDALASLTPLNSDADTKADYLDIDSDNDGIVDIIEGQTTAGYATPAGSDTDGDGLDDTYDNVDTNGTFGGNASNGITPTNTDSTDTADYIDADSDNDGKPDRLEGWDTNGNNLIDGAEKVYVGTTDTDGDGLLDEYDAIAGIATANNVTNSNAPASFPDVNNPGADRDWRQFVTCTGVLTNGSFELPVQTGNGNHIFGAGVSIPGWRVGGNAAFNLVIPGGSYNGGPNNAQAGTQYLDITNSAGIFTQIFDLTCASSLTFSGYFSSRETSGTYINWTAKLEILTITGTVVATSTTRDFTNADGDSGTDAVWYLLGGATNGTIPAGRYIYKVTMGDFGNFENAGLCVTGCYKYPDRDGDLVGSVNDIDDDNDGITDLIENGGFDAYGDVDNDGIPNYTDTTPGAGQPVFTDSNSDGINDYYDADKDGIINSEDNDSDNDGIADIVEAGGIDTNGDGRVDSATDTDGDGLANTYDTDNGGVTIANLDTDGDGIVNSLDLDSDNDGIPDTVEAGGTDVNNDGKLDGFTDTDTDGFADIVDGDVGNDGTAENTTAVLIITSTAGGTPGRPASYPRANQDANGLPNPYDLDSDGDGILDSREAGLTQDTNNDGVIKSGDTGFTDTNGDGWSDQVDAVASLTPVNTDGRGRANYLDIDSDDDGIVDNIEGQTTAGYTAPTGTDTDGDGIDNAYDNAATFGGNASNGITPTNSDAIDLVDYLDLDSDNDGYPDSFEGHDTNGDNQPDVGSPANNGVSGGLTDADGDGLLDGYDNNTASPDATNGTTANSYPNIDGGTAERDWREIANTDNSAGGNTTDIDDDNDGIPDITECGGFDPTGDADGDGIRNYLDPVPGVGMPAFTDANADGINDYYDADQDGIINSLDLDSDNDGIADLVEAGGIDTNGDGRVDIATDTDGDGLADTYDTSNGGVNIANLDTDGDGIPNSRDLDSDNDGIPDVIEAGGADINNDGKIDGYTDTDGDGFAQTVDGDANNDGTAENTAGALIITSTTGGTPGRPAGYPRANADANGLPNPYDLDSDGDGILDVREAGLADANNDGVADGTLGTDGWSDTVDALGSFTPTNSDGDTKPDYLDIDADNDGITDNVEGQTSAAYMAPSGADSDGDGIDDNYDNNDAAFAGNASNGITPNNHDSADLPDYRDADTDNDGLTDVKEGNDWNGNGKPDENTTLSGLDADGDGLDNIFDLVTGPDVTVVGYGGTGSRATVQRTPGTATDKDWRNALYALPVQFIDVNAVRTGGNVNVSFTVSNELHIKNYVVERSVDGNVFTTAGTVAFNDSNGKQQTYSFTDAAVPANAAVVYYRIRQVDTDGRFTISKVVLLRLAGRNRLTVMGNPVAAGNSITVNISAEKKGEAVLEVLNMEGKTIALKKQQVSAGDTLVRFEPQHSFVAGGIYFIRATINGELFTAKINIH